MKKATIYTIVILSIGLSSCKKFLEPFPDNRLTLDNIKSTPEYAEGILLNAYNDMPSVSSFDLDVITDDAVTNNLNSNYLLMATGGWTSTNNPIGVWSRAYTDIYYINSFLEIKDEVIWDARNKNVNDMHLQRLTGEAYGLRAWWQFQLLQAHAGVAYDGQLLGYPIVLKPISTSDNSNLSRNTFAECVAQIVADCDAAIANLPDKYVDTGDSDHNLALGTRWTNRMTGYAARALKSSVLLFAASPAFNPSNDLEKWKQAAVAAGELLKMNGGVNSLSQTGLTFFKNHNDPEVIWYNAISSARGLETANFPPSLSGNGRTNPTQELVDAFPMKDGYPIDRSSVSYQANPYANRDPRLAAYIIYNGNNLGVKGNINTYVGAPQNGINAQTNSTRTGYYLKKLLLDNVSLTAPATSQDHFLAYFRFTEIFLNYAEAANEAYGGPDADPEGFGFTPRTILTEIRKRAGISQPDAYLATRTTQGEFQQLVRNERRLELCFEGFRFNDLRRWEDLTAYQAPVNGVFITAAGGVPVNYSYQQVEERRYQDYMIYGPIPNSEILKSNQLQQNKGW